MEIHRILFRQYEKSDSWYPEHIDSTASSMAGSAIYEGSLRHSAGSERHLANDGQRDTRNTHLRPGTFSRIVRP
jgi:hypothetical protein